MTKIYRVTFDQQYFSNVRYVYAGKLEDKARIFECKFCDVAYVLSGVSLKGDPNIEKAFQIQNVLNKENITRYLSREEEVELYHKYKHKYPPVNVDEYNLIIVPINKIIQPKQEGGGEIPEPRHFERMLCSSNLKNILQDAEIEVWYYGMFYTPCTFCKYMFFHVAGECTIHDEHTCHIDLVFNARQVLL